MARKAKEQEKGIGALMRMFKPRLYKRTLSNGDVIYLQSMSVADHEAFVKEHLDTPDEIFAKGILYWLRDENGEPVLTSFDDLNALDQGTVLELSETIFEWLRDPLGKNQAKVDLN
ncbi:hypothetical protein [Shewanella sp. MM_2022_3]|uniref:hypothetical protein n=1 Tax=Shewanella sp. MM_2022_3 TaxID=2923280 RepID=UPI001F4BEB77|nr:hypothetical protein [Shewanella sp. MM_2022_3]MCH7421461.1 hypothetical protein [Shewanella sp. MM_2022_3]